jgi:hypothetical protein
MKAAKPKKALWRRALRALLVLLATLVVLVVLAIGFLHTRWGKDVVRGRIEAKLAAAVNGTVKVGSLDYTFMLGEVHVGGIEIADAAGRPAIRVDRLDVDLDRGSLLARDPLIERLGVHGLALTVVKSADGRSNLTGLFKSSNKKASLAHLRVAQLTVDGTAKITKADGTVIDIADLALAGSLDARPVAQELDASLQKLAATLSLAKPGAVARRVELGIGSVTLARRASGVDVTLAAIAAGPLGIESLAAHAGLGDGHLKGDQQITLQHARVDRAKLATLLGRDVLRDDVALDLTLRGPLEQLVVAGSVRTGAASLKLDGTANLAAARPTYTLALVGNQLTSAAVVIKRKLPELTSDVRIELTGSGIKRGDIEAKLDLAIRAFDVDIAGSGTVGLDQSMHGTFTVGTSPAEAFAEVEKSGIVIPPRIAALKPHLPPRLDLLLTADGRLDGELALTLAPLHVELAKGKVSLAGSAQLVNKKVKTATAHVTLASLDLASLSAIAGRPPKVRGSVSGTIDAFQEGLARRTRYDLSVRLAKPALTIGARGTADANTAVARATIKSGTMTLGTIDATVPLGKQDGKLALRRTGPWKVALDLVRRPAAELAALLPPRLRAKLPHGDVALHLALAGTPARPTGTFALAATHDDKHVDVKGTVTSTAGGLSLATKTTLAMNSDPLALVDTVVTMPAPFATGTLDVKALRAGAAVDATVELPSRTFGSLAALRPSLAKLDTKLGGTLDGRITAKGPLATPAIDATVRWRGYQTAAGTTGETVITASGTAAALTATVRHNDAVAIVAQIDRRNPRRIGIKATARASDTPLLPLLPAFLATKIGAHDPGRLRWNMDGTLALVRGPAGLTVEDVNVTGSLDVTGAAVAIPNSDRHYRDIGLTVAVEPAGLRLTASAKESDAANTNRRVGAHGLLTLEGRRPKSLALSLVASDWLLFGAKKLGPADAPRAAADFDIDVAVDFTTPILSVDATVKSLAFRAPERYERGHYAEPMMDDVIELSPGVTPGKLPVTAPVVVAAAPPPKKRPIDIRVHIPNPVRLNQTPLDIEAHGELVVTVRDTGTKTRGALAVDGGTLYIMGKDYQLVDGRISFDDEHPHGRMAMKFDHRLPDAALRELSIASGGTGTQVVFDGAPSKPAVSLAGAGNGGLEDNMAMNGIGQGVHVTRPDLPASETVQAPRGDQLSIMTFMASNLPHLVFIDRMKAWSDPADSPYGQIKHVEAERYTQGDRARVRAVVRPTVPGRSAAELQYDRMLIHNDRAAVGVGLRAGDRLGGGVGVFLEWSSKD